MATPNPHGHSPPYWTKFDRTKDNAKFVFNKTIAGHYRNGRTYSRVGVLLLTWEADDMHLQQSEVKRLETIFKDKFGYDTKNFQIPSEKSETALLHTVTEFIHEYNSPDNLMIVYYGGHGYTGTETQLFKLAAKMDADGDGDPTTFFDDIFMCLRLPQTDILFIIDCCFAARAFHREGLGKRKYELIAAAAPEARVPSAKHKDSFTCHLSDTLEEMLVDEKCSAGFSTSDLYRRVYHQRTEEVKPFLFDQSRHDYGRIWLQPHKITVEQLLEPVKNSVRISLSLKLRDTPTPAEMNELARALQYIPHVNEIEFGALRAPAEEIREFFNGMRRLMYIKRVIKNLRGRIAAKKKQELESNAAIPVSLRQLSLRTPPVVDHFQSPDWSEAEAILPVSMVTGNTATQSPTSENLPPPEWPTPLKPQGLIGGLFVACSVISGHIRPYSPWEEDKVKSTESFVPKDDEVAEQRLAGEGMKKRGSMASIVLATIAKHDREKQIMDRLMWVSTLIGVWFLFFTVHNW